MSDFPLSPVNPLQPPPGYGNRRGHMLGSYWKREDEREGFPALEQVHQSLREIIQQDLSSPLESCVAEKGSSRLLEEQLLTHLPYAPPGR